MGFSTKIYLPLGAILVLYISFEKKLLFLKVIDFYQVEIDASFLQRAVDNQSVFHTVF